MRVILLTLVISAAAAVIRPVQEETAEAEIEQEKSEQKKPVREPLTARKTAGAA
jgi:predicted transcriptional regulator